MSREASTKHYKKIQNKQTKEKHKQRKDSKKSLVNDIKFLLKKK